MKETFKQFKERVLHPEDDIFAILFLNFITVRLSYIITKYKLKITPNQITYIRMIILSPLIISLLIIAPIYSSKLAYVLVLILSYLFLLSDWLDGQVARGTRKTSKKGAILDSIADRFSTIIFLVLLFSIGIAYGNILIVSSTVVLFTLKCFHMMVITKLFYYGEKDKSDKNKMFDGADAMSSMGVSKIFKVTKWLKGKIGLTRWGGTLGGSDRFFITIMLPIILMLLGYTNLLSLLLWAYIIFLALFFILRIKGLFKNLK